ncbi:MAG: Rpn family recombination-promoting nuclease/putative transposase [Lentimicrobiaceae bacterium]|jgi:predicted transposase/invertase (TIGR01784 family)|nr:Rpn family recombination-promoting nuclease/putative transposase [Lentimicrobiaceae bacterium]
MPRYLDPKNDLTFKRIFGEHKHLCMSLLNSILPLDVPIISIEYLPVELTPEIPENKNSIVDVRCIDQNGRQFIVEMQMYWTDAFTSRVLFNASKAYVRQLTKGKDYKYLQPVYALAFVNEIFEPTKPEEYYHHYKIVNVQDTNEQIKGLEFVFIELPKFKPGNKGEKKLHELWLDFLNIEDATVHVPAELFDEAATREALGYLEEGAYTEAQMNAYDHYWDVISTEKMFLSSAFADGMVEGMAKGEAKGKAEGKAEGLAEGKAEERFEIVRNSLRAGLPIETISQITGLSPEEIEALK